MAFLATTKKEFLSRGWDCPDVIIITGDAYVDHPSYGAAVIGRVLEDAGFRVGIIAQPDWRTTADFKRLGKPRLFFGITAGNLDSMVSNYTSAKRPRKRDDYSPGGTPGLRPDRATVVYANRVREAYRDVPIVIGGMEASLRRFAHYDWWDNDVRRSILFDARADILVYGMGEMQILEIAKRVEEGRDLSGIRGTAVVQKAAESGEQRADINMRMRLNIDAQTREGMANSERESQIANLLTHVSTMSDELSTIVEIPSYEEVKEDKEKFNEAFRIISENQDPFRGRPIAQRHGTRHIVQFPPPFPMQPRDLDHIYELPYKKAWHPSYDKKGGVPGFETTRFSIISHRGCCGNCSFCALSMHQGRIVQSRSAQSILREARALTERKDFRGTITDIGGPTANLYQARCDLWQDKGACRNKNCLVPATCKNLQPGYRASLDLYRKIMELPKVKHVFIESGFRYDLLIRQEASEYLRQVCMHHISGQMKVAPEHCVDHVLKVMNKPSFGIYEHFVKKFDETKKKAGKKLFLVNYFISAHPGTTLEDALKLAVYLKKRGIHPQQIQDFMPLPMTLSGTIYHTQKDPFTGRHVYVAKTFRERKMHRALIQYNNPGNRPLIREALKILGKEHLADDFLRTTWKKANVQGRG